ncbi:MAG: helix-turn-helix domain-containing protein [Candidatus Omnitrophica bacterium]|nr:helix-turn-helix domain-containing protein [Candidatus Omnitrophota bacterium]
MERFICIKEAAEFLGIKEMTLYTWRHKGIIPCYKVQGKLLFRLSELNKYAEKYKEPLLVRG